MTDKADKVVDLKLFRTQKSDPVFVIEQRIGRDCDGRLIWEGGTSHIQCPNNEDPNRYDAQIVQEHIRYAFNWCELMPGKKAGKLTRKLAQLLKQAEDL